LRVETIRGRLQAHRGAEELLDFARTTGLRLALATSGRRSYVDAILAESRFTGRFDVEVTGESVTHGKPDPETYLLAASRLDVAPAGCVVLEDAPNGIAAAVAAGMRSGRAKRLVTGSALFRGTGGRPARLACRHSLVTGSRCRQQRSVRRGRGVANVDVVPPHNRPSLENTAEPRPRWDFGCSRYPVRRPFGHAVLPPVALSAPRATSAED